MLKSKRAVKQPRFGRLNQDKRINASFTSGEHQRIAAAAKLHGYQSLSAWVADVAAARALVVIDAYAKKKAAAKTRGLPAGGDL